MGNSCSSMNGIGTSEYLKRLCSSEVICENDPFWNALLAFSLVDLDLVAMSSSNSKLLEDTISPLCKNISINNTKTGNFHTLVMYFIRRLDAVITSGVSDTAEETNPFIWQVLNGLFIIRSICKHFVQNLSEEVIIQQFLKPHHHSSEEKTETEEQEPDKTITNFMHALVKGLTALPIHETTVLLQLEIVNVLITLLGMVMYQTDSAANNVFYIEMMQGEASEHCETLLLTLIQAYAHKDILPSYAYKESETHSLSATLWSVMTLGMGGPSVDVKKVNLGSQCALLTLILITHSGTDNPYKRYVTKFLAAEERNVVKPEVLYLTLCSDLSSEYGILLLYTLLHENQVMKAFILSRSDVEKLIMPLLQVLYTKEGSSHHVYLSLIILLILTEDSGFSADLFSTQINEHIKWYTDKHLQSISLGDLLILVIIKVMQHNMVHSKDHYLHTNCLATLANCSCKYANLNTYTCQKLIGFFMTLARRHHKIIAKIQVVSIKAQEKEDMELTQLRMDLEGIEEMIRMLMEILNSCFTHTVHHNTHLVHVMLCHKEEFDKFREIESFRNILQNIHLVLEQFHNRLEREFGEQPRSVSEVLHVIEDGLKTFKRTLFTKFPDLKFRYVEETDSSQFFVPYVWQIVCRESNLHFKHPAAHV